MIEIRAICRRDFPHDVVAVHLRRASPIVPGFIVTAECHKVDGRGRASRWLPLNLKCLEGIQLNYISDVYWGKIHWEYVKLLKVQLSHEMWFHLNYPLISEEWRRQLVSNVWISCRCIHNIITWSDFEHVSWRTICKTLLIKHHAYTPCIPVHIMKIMKIKDVQGFKFHKQDKKYIICYQNSSTFAQKYTLLT